MPEQSSEARRFDWSDFLPFAPVFRSFRLAILPGKMLLALAALIVTALGGCLLDTVWLDRHDPLPREIEAFWQTPEIGSWRKQARAEQVNAIAAAYLTVDAAVPEGLDKAVARDSADAVDQALEAVEKSFEQARIAAKDDDQAIAEAARKHNAIHRALREIRPRGISSTFMEYQTTVAAQTIKAATAFNLLGNMNEVLNGRRGGAGPGFQPIATGRDGFGVLPCLLLAIRGEQWLVTQHFWYYVLFAVFCLAVWAYFGGAICRMAALNFARDESIPVKSALAFSQRKFVGLFSAPLLPIVIVAMIGVVIALPTLALGWIPFLGEILLAIGAGLALVGGFIMAIVILGALAATPLMWPGIAVEGSDGFDAMSRSFSYVFARPWKAAMYAGSALVHGAVCYLFVRLVVLVMLRSSRFAMGWAMNIWSGPFNRPGTGDADASKLDAMWPIPTYDSLWRSPPPFGAEGIEGPMSWLIAFWVILLAMLTCAFLMSYLFSSSTIIYYLLRRDTDAIDLEDVYVDEDEEPQAAAPSTVAATAGGGVSLPVMGTPPAPAPAPSAPPPTEPAAEKQDEEETSSEDQDGDEKDND